MTEIKKHLKKLNRTSLKKESRRSFLRLDMNENPKGLPEKFVTKVFSKIDAEYLCMYPEYYRFEKKLASYNNLESENIFLSNGSDGAIKQIFDAYISPGDNVLLTDPTFAMYDVYCDMYEAKKIVIPYNSDLSFPTEKYIKNITKKNKMAVIVNPNNPTGSMINQKYLDIVARKVLENDALLVVDEAYYYFTPETFIDKVKKYKNLIILRTFSKLCGIASCRLGFAAASCEIINNLKKVKPTYDVNGIGVLIADAILSEKGLIKKMIEESKKGEKYLEEKLLDAGINHIPGHANFILINCNNKVNYFMKELAEKKILVNGEFKQDYLKNFIRVTVGPKDLMEKFWEAFIEIWKTAH